MAVDRYIQALGLVDTRFRGFIACPSLATQATILDSDVGHWHDLSAVNWKRAFPSASLLGFFLTVVMLVVVAALVPRHRPTGLGR